MDRIGLEILFDDQWGGKQAFLDYKNLYFKKSLLKIAYLFVFGQNEDHLVKEQANPDTKKYWFYIVVIPTFFEGVNQWFWTKIGNFLFVFKQNKP